ncbi:MAG: EAL domain-containing protein [Solirubrobacteraceae bacterium]|nr:EAL domain-containing protein [Solirubrobacteraceae bacterium]
MALLPARAFGALCAVALIAYLFMPAWLADVAYDAFGLACVAAIGWLVASGRVTRGRGAWILFALGNLLWVLGDVTIAIITANVVDGTEPFPSVSDALYLAGFPVVAAGVVWAARLRGPTRDFVSALDGIVVAAAAAVPLYVFWLEPALDDTSLSTFGLGVSAAYPVMDLLLLAVGVRFFLGSGTRNTATTLLALGLVATVGSDFAYNVLLLAGTYSMPHPVDLGWLVSYTCWGLAALHPSAAQVLDPGTARFGVPLRSRLWILVAAVALPVTVIAAAFISGRDLDLGVVLVPLAVISVAMVLRLRLLARSGSTVWRGAALLAAAGFTVVSVSVALTQVHASTDRQEATADQLTAALAQAERVDGEAARTLSAGTDVSLGVWHDLQVERVALMRRIADLGPSINPREQDAVDRLMFRYLDAVRGQVDLVQGDQPKAASVAGMREVVPAHDRLAGRLDSLSVHHRDRADRSALLGRIGTVVVLLASLIVLTALLLKYGGVSRAASLARERNRAAREGEQRLAALVEGSADILTVIDANTTIAGHAESVERVLGYPEGTLLGTELAELLRPGHADHIRRLLSDLEGALGASETLTFQILRADGSWLDAEARVVNQTDDPLLGGFVVTVRDVSDRKQLEAELEHQAFHDPLTGLANRPLLTDRLRQALTRSVEGSSLQAMVLLDVDDFKAVNDSLGHGRGDDLLREIARRLSDCVRSQDTLARVGGDAFALLIEDAEGDGDAMRTAERMLEAIQSSPVSLEGGQHGIRASIGVAITDGSGPGSTIDRSNQLFRNAELAMYEAKREEGGRIELFESHMHDAVTKRLELKSEMVRALEREEFTLVYQPIVDIAGRTILGYEALVRWVHPTRGFISPGDFVPIAEQTGLIVELGTWVLREACRQLAAWLPGWDAPRYVSVNVAGHQLQRDDFSDQVRSALSDSGLSPRHLLLEMTESSLIQDTEGSVRRIDELRALGVRLAIDDFGTGYSSLSYLHRFSIDVLKIDKSFIDRVTEEGPGGALVDAIVNMASSLGLAVVAEGIEEPAQVRALVDIRCELGQGYHYARPLPVGDVAAFELAPGPAAPVQQGPLRILR